MSHEVMFRPPARELDRSDVKFVVKQNGKNLGTLTVSKGSLVWFRGKTRKNGRKLDWSQFDSLVMEHATKYEAR